MFPPNFQGVHILRQASMLEQLLLPQIGNSSIPSFLPAIPEPAARLLNVASDIMEKLPSYNLVLSLEQMALRRIAVALFSEPRILASFVDDIRCWKDVILEPVQDKATELHLPESLSKQLMLLLRHVCSELIDWRDFHRKYIGDSISTRLACLQKVRWTTVGTVDRRRTAEELVRCDGVDMKDRFELALLYGLEEDIPLLWEELPVEDKKTFCESRVETPHLQTFLPYILGKELGRPLPDSEMTTFLYGSAMCGYRALAAYCLGKLTREEREASLVETARRLIRSGAGIGYPYCRERKFTDVVCYLLSVMTPEEQVGIFQELPCQIIECFLVWPWQDLAVEIADIICSLIPGREYFDLMRTVGRGKHRTGCYFPNLVQNLLLRSPIEFRKRFVDDDYDLPFRFFDHLFEYGDMETVKVVFRIVEAADRLRFVSFKSGLRVIDRWNRSGVHLGTATLSEESKKKLKETFLRWAAENDIAWTIRCYRRFLEFCEQSDASAGNKRSSEDQMLTKSKRTCERELNSSE